MMGNYILKYHRPRRTGNPLFEWAKRIGNQKIKFCFGGIFTISHKECPKVSRSLFVSILT